VKVPWLGGKGDSEPTRLWTDGSFKSGENAAQKALQQLAGRKRRVPDSDKSLARENCLVSQ